VSSRKPAARCCGVPPLPPTYISPPDSAEVPPLPEVASTSITFAPACAASIAAQAPAAPKPTTSTPVSRSQRGTSLVRQGRLRE